MHPKSPAEAVDDRLAELHADYDREKNPVFVWEALSWIFEVRKDANFPDWVLGYLIESTRNVTQLLDEHIKGGGVTREAQTVGIALGFVSKGKGSTPYFEEAFLLSRARMLHRRVQQKLANGDKRDFAIQYVAEQFGYSKSTVDSDVKRIEAIEGKSLSAIS